MILNSSTSEGDFIKLAFLHSDHQFIQTRPPKNYQVILVGQWTNCHYFSATTHYCSETDMNLHFTNWSKLVCTKVIWKSMKSSPYFSSDANQLTLTASTRQFLSRTKIFTAVLSSNSGVGTLCSVYDSNIILSFSSVTTNNSTLHCYHNCSLGLSLEAE